MAGILRWLVSLSLTAVFLICTGCSPAQPEVTLPVKIGAPQGAGGILVAYVAAKMGVETEQVEVFSIHDCCSSYAQWALSSQSVNVAVVCIDAAQYLVKQDDRYSIIGPCLANSDLIVVRDLAKVQSIGIMQNHQYQEDMVRKMFGDTCQVKPMLPTALPYAYADGTVDGVVVDIGEALRLSGNMLPTGGEQGDLVTYVLVVSKEFQKSADFNRLLTVFREAAVELNDPDKLQEAMNSYSPYPVEENEAAQWIQNGIRFMTPE